MSENIIGLKVADGSYYPILPESEPGKKKLILTTVKDEQTNVQINLYKGSDENFSDAQYIGSLVIEEIAPTQKGDAEIELILGIDKEGTLTASAGDVASGEHQSLSVSLESLTEDDIYDIPDFELDQEYEPSPGITPEEETELAAESYGTDVEESALSPPPRKFNPFMLILVVVLCLAALFALGRLILKIIPEEYIPPLVSGWIGDGQSSSVVIADEDVDSSAAVTESSEVAVGSADSSVSVSSTAETAVSSEAAVSSASSSSAVSSSSSSTPSPVSPVLDEGQPHDIVWGDTLWDLAERYYGNPWYYRYIAEKNNIMNPDLIYGGTQIIIPELKM